jgi:hypothetical protein
MRLKSWNEFTAGMAGYMTQFDPRLRKHILVALFHQAGQREWLEGIREDVKSKAPQLHAERIRVGRLRRRVQKAVKAVQKADIKGNQGFLSRDYVGEAILLLKLAHSESQFLENAFMARIHPALRKKKEKAVTTNLDTEGVWPLFPGFGGAKVDQMFVQWMADYLEKLVTRQGKRLSPGAINKIICETVAAAFGGGFSTEGVKTTRRRLRKKLQLLGQT